MSLTGDQSGKDRKEFAFNLTLAIVVGQVGCLTLVIILAALFGGLWLDGAMDTKPLFTIILMAASVPLTLVMMFWVVKKATAKFQANSKKNESQN